MLTVQGVYEYADSCGDHPLKLEGVSLEGAETLLALGSCGCKEPNPEYLTCGSWCDSGSFALGRLSDGRYITVRENSDSTGHGCQCNGSADVYATLEEAISLGLTDSERKHYGKESK
jgi:hypothetical protein